MIIDKIMCVFLFSLLLNQVAAVDRSLFGTKTAYKWVWNPEPPIEDNLDMKVDYQGRTCMAIHVNMLLRHGSRYPEEDDMKNMKDLLEKTKGHTEPAGSLGTWNLTVTSEQGDMLDLLVGEEMKGIGFRTGQRFKQLLMDKTDRLEYISSSKGGASESGQNFSEGLLNCFLNTTISTTPSENNALLGVYDSCPYFTETVENNDATTEELDRFKNTARYKEVLENVTKRFNGTGDFSLSDADLEYMWEMCAFEMMEDRNDTWCHFMDDTERKVMNEAGDIEDYYEDSYGNGVSGEIHCVVLKKLFGVMDAAIHGHQNNFTNFTVGSFMFGHSATIMGTVTALQLFRDVNPLRASDIDENRRFKTSLVSPMAANVGFALYACPDPSGKLSDTRYAVKLFHNERPMQLGHTNSEIYWYDQYKKAFTNTLKRCVKEDLCKYPRSDGKVPKLSWLELVAAMSFFILL